MADDVEEPKDLEKKSQVLEKPEEKEATRPLHVFLIAGEASGDALGGAVMRALRDKCGGAVRFSGIGGAAMTREGLASLFPMQELSVMGLAEIVPKLRHFMRLIKQAIDKIEKEKPDILVTIDSPDFSLRVARALHRRFMSRFTGRVMNQDLNRSVNRPEVMNRVNEAVNRVKTVHYVAPSVWAWRPGRARRIARFLDGLICLLPFEPPYFEKEGLPAIFAGHPVVDGPFARAQGERFRARAGIDPQRKLLGLLPGSRGAELTQTGVILVQAAVQILNQNPEIGLVIPTLPHLKDKIKELLKQIESKKIFIVDSPDEKADAFAACDAALATSGTVGLELAAAAVPHVIAYRMKALSWQIIRCMVRVRYAHLVNILLDAPVVPEFLQQDCTAGRIAPVVMELLEGGARARAQKARFVEAMALLGQGRAPSPAERAADFILDRSRESRVRDLTNGA